MFFRTSYLQIQNLLIVTLVISLSRTLSAGDGFQSLFNGRDLTGWEGVPGAWVVENGAIKCTGRKDGGRNWLIWRGGEVSDFELQLKVRFTSGNSGVQVRSEERDDFQVCGYQVEVAASEKMGLWHHSLSPEKYRSHLATAGQKGLITGAGEKSASDFADRQKVQSSFKDGEWNDMIIIARGPTLVQIVNGVVLAELTDHDQKYARTKGVLAFQDHGRGTVAEFKEIFLRPLEPNDSAVVFEDAFERDAIGENWKVVMPNFTVREGRLLGQEDPARGHGCVVRHMVDFQDAVFEFEFNFIDGKNFNFVINDKNCKSVHAGHICRVAISPARIRIADDKEGFMKNEIFKLRQDPARREELQSLLKDKNTIIKKAISAKEWHAARIEIANDQISVNIDGEFVGSLSSPGIAHPTKTDFGFTVTGQRIEFDNVRFVRVSQAHSGAN